MKVNTVIFWRFKIRVYTVVGIKNRKQGAHGVWEMPRTWKNGVQRILYYVVPDTQPSDLDRLCRVTHGTGQRHCACPVLGVEI